MENHVLLTVETHRTMTSFMRIRLLKWLLKVSQKMLQKEEFLLIGYESVTLNIDVMVNIAVLRTVKHVKERKLT